MRTQLNYIKLLQKENIHSRSSLLAVGF